MSKLIVMEFNGVVCDHFAATRRARDRVNHILSQCSIDCRQFWRLHDDLEPQLQSAVVEGYLSAEEYQWHRFADVCQSLTGCAGTLPYAIGSVLADELIGKVSIFSDVPSAFADLYRAGFRIALVASGLSSTEREKFRVAGLGDIIENRRFYVSEEYGMLASDGEFLREVLADNGVNASTAIFVGANLKRGVWLAESQGLRGILLDRDDDMGASYAGERVLSLDGLVQMLIEEPAGQENSETAIDIGVSRGFIGKPFPFLL